MVAGRPRRRVAPTSHHPRLRPACLEQMHQEEPYLAELALVELALAWVPQLVAATEPAAGDSELELPAERQVEQLGELDQQSQPSRPPSFDRA